MKEFFFTPIHVKQPPCHTQIKPRCLTCKKFPVCSIRDDYLKTATLIEEVLGNPQFDRKINCYDSDCCISTPFYGYEFDNPEEIFPETILTQAGETGIFEVANYGNKDIIQFMYNIKKGNVLFKVCWDKKKKEYVFGVGREIYYGFVYELSPHSIAEIQSQLNIWREEMKEKELHEKKLDVINTTYFSAQLNCAFYEQEKGLTEEEGFKRMYADCSCEKDPCHHRHHHNPYKHIVTYHIEDQEIPCYKPCKKGFCPMPVYFPPKCNKEPAPPPRKRGDRNCEC